MSEMTAMRMGSVARWATVILLIAAWAVGGTRLWRTSVPGNLDTGGLDPGRFFGAARLAEAHRYSLVLDLISIAGIVATLVALAVLARRAPRFAKGIGLGPIGSGIVVGMVTLVTLWFTSLPFGLAAQWWAARHGLAPHDYLAWLAAPWATLSFEAAYALVAIVVVMALARALGRNWWLAGAPVLVGLSVLFAFLGGFVAASGTTQLPPRLRGEVAALEQQQRIDVPVRELKVSDWTSQANAFTAGLGPSTRVVVWNTLLDGRFSPAQVRVVVAHELGHVERRHLWKSLGWLALIAFPVAFLVAEATRPAGGLRSPAAIPLAFLVLTLAGLAASPLENAVSRRYEAEADWAALQATRDPAAATALFRSFARTSLEQPDPPLWDYVLFQNHPTLAQRIAMAQRWAQSARKSANGTPSRAASTAPRASSSSAAATSSGRS
jgi:STE24 endopeptidase